MKKCTKMCRMCILGLCSYTFWLRVSGHTGWKSLSERCCRKESPHGRGAPCTQIRVHILVLKMLLSKNIIQRKTEIWKPCRHFKTRIKFFKAKYKYEIVFCNTSQKFINKDTHSVFMWIKMKTMTRTENKYHPLVMSKNTSMMQKERLC